MEDAFDGGAVLALPTDDFGCAESPVARLGGEVGEFTRSEMIDRRDVEFGHVRAVFGGHGDGLEVFGERGVFAEEGVGEQ